MVLSSVNSRMCFQNEKCPCSVAPFFRAGLSTPSVILESGSQPVCVGAHAAIAWPRVAAHRDVAV